MGLFMLPCFHVPLALLALLPSSDSPTSGLGSRTPPWEAPPLSFTDFVNVNILTDFTSPSSWLLTPACSIQPDPHFWTPESWLPFHISSSFFNLSSQKPLYPWDGALHPAVHNNGHLSLLNLAFSLAIFIINIINTHHLSSTSWF
jgi:hypothetical protein